MAVTRGRVGGLTVLAKYGPEHFARINKGRSFSAYGDSPAARKVRAMDVAAKRGMTTAQWERRMRERAISFGVPVERLIPRLRQEA